MRGKATFRVFIIVLSIYSITAPGHIWNTDGWTRYIVTESLVKYGRPIISEEYIGVLGDIWVVEGSSGDYYSYYGIGQSLVMLPLYSLGRWIANSFGDLGAASLEQFFASFLNTFVGALLAIAVFQLARYLGYKERTALWVTILVAFGTIVWAHSRDNYDHLLEALCVVSSYTMLVVGVSRGSLWCFLVAGLLAAVGLVTRMSTACAFPGFAILILFGEHISSVPLRDWNWWWLKIRRGLWFVVGILPGLLFNLWYNSMRFGSWGLTGYEQKAPEWFGNSIWLGMADFLVSPGRGLLPYVPLICALPLFYRPFWRRSAVFATAVLVTSVTYLLFYSQFGRLGLWSWGPHYLLPIIPLLVLPWAEALESWSLLSRLRRTVFIVLVTLSCTLQLASVSASYLRTYVSAASAGVHIDSALDWDLEWSPLLKQWENIFHVVHNIATSRDFESVTALGVDHQYLLDNELALNVLDWWWVLAMYRGVRWAWVIAAIALWWAMMTLFRLLKALDGTMSSEPTRISD